MDFHAGGVPWGYEDPAAARPGDEDYGANWLGGHHADDGSPCRHGVPADQASGPAPAAGQALGWYTCRGGRPWARGQPDVAVVVIVEARREWGQAVCRAVLYGAPILTFVLAAFGIGLFVPASWVLPLAAIGIGLIAAGLLIRRG